MSGSFSYGYLTPDEISGIIDNFRTYYKSLSAWKVFQPEETYILNGIVTNVLYPLLDITKIEKPKIPELEAIIRSRFVACRIEKRPGKSIGHEVSELGKDLIQINFKSFHAPGSLKANASSFRDVEDIMRLSAKRQNQLGKLIFRNDIGIFSVFNLRKELVGVTMEDLLLSYDPICLGDRVEFTVPGASNIVLYKQTLSDPLIVVNGTAVDNTALAAQYCLLSGIRLLTETAPYMLRLYMDVDVMMEAGLSPDGLFAALNKQLLGTEARVIMGNFDSKIANSLDNSLDSERALVVEIYFSLFSVRNYFEGIGIPYDGNPLMTSSYISSAVVPIIFGTEAHPVYIKGVPRILQVNPVVKGMSSFIGIVTQLDDTWFKYDLNRYSADAFGVSIDRVAKVLGLYGFTVRTMDKFSLEVNASQKKLNASTKMYSDYIDKVDLDNNEMIIYIVPGLSTSHSQQIFELFSNQLIRSGFEILRIATNSITVRKMIKFMSLHEILEVEHGVSIQKVETKGDRSFLTVRDLQDSVLKLQTVFSILEYKDNVITIERYPHTNIMDDLRMYFGYAPYDIIYGETIGGNMNDLLSFRLANTQYTRSNNPQEIYHNLGIEALHNFLLAELYEILISNGVSIDVAILTTLEAYVTNKAYGIAFNFKGLNNYIYDNVNTDFYETVDETEEIVDETALQEQEQEAIIETTHEKEDEVEDTEKENKMHSTSFAKLLQYQQPSTVLLKAATAGTFSDLSTLAAAELVSEVPKIGGNIPKVETLIDSNEIGLKVDVYTKGKNIRLLSDLPEPPPKIAIPIIITPKLGSGLNIRARVNIGEVRAAMTSVIIRTPSGPPSNQDGITTINLTMKVSMVKPPTMLPPVVFA